MKRSSVSRGLVVPFEHVPHFGQTTRGDLGIAVTAGCGDQPQLVLHPDRLPGREFGTIGPEYAHLPCLVVAQRADDALTFVQ